MIRLNTRGGINRIGKRLTPPLAAAVSRVGGLNGIELLASYFNLLAGKGCGTGWDKGEEAAIAKVIRECMQDEPVVIDCGANHGEWTREVRQRLGSDRGEWVALEPDPSCATILERMDNLEVIQAAVGEQPGLATLYSNQSGSGLASLHKRRDTLAQGQAFTLRSVEVVTLDGVIAERGLNRVDFLKMDIEGHELFALKGVTKALERGVVKALSFEFGISNVNSRTFFRDFWELLTPLGFELKRICPGGVIMPITEYYEDLEFFRGVSNYIGILKNR